MKKLLIVSCTKLSDTDKTSTLLWGSLDDNGFTGRSDVDIVFVTDNAIGLSAVYNRFLTNTYLLAYENIAFIHDDVYVDDPKLVRKLNDAHSKYDIVGVAGCVNPSIQHPALWHIMCGNADNRRGYAFHFLSNDHSTTGPISVASFGPTPARVALVDGLFVSVKTSAILRSKWKWNEAFEFHHYDIASCIDANAKGLKIGVS